MRYVLPSRGSALGKRASTGNGSFSTAGQGGNPEPSNLKTPTSRTSCSLSFPSGALVTRIGPDADSFGMVRRAHIHHLGALFYARPQPWNRTARTIRTKSAKIL